MGLLAASGATIETGASSVGCRSLVAQQTTQLCDNPVCAHKHAAALVEYIVELFRGRLCIGLMQAACGFEVILNCGQRLAELVNELDGGLPQLVTLWDWQIIFPLSHISGHWSASPERKN
jgi:hypothetical protein